jgi:hypothetical protein
MAGTFMSTDTRRSAASLAARREDLIAQCAQQRVGAASGMAALVAPLGKGQSEFGSQLKLPLTIAGVVLGLIATRPGRALPMITAGLSLWKLARSALSVLRVTAAGGEDRSGE